MKHALRILFLAFVALSSTLMISCEGPSGPPGPPGPQGPQGPAGGDGGEGGGGVNIANEVFELTVDFSVENQFFQAFILDPAIEESDVVLAFLLWEFDDGTDIWRKLPTNIFLDEGILQYNYDFTTGDFGLFLEGNFNLDNLGSEWTDDQVFRIVLVPGQFAANQEDLPETYEELVHMLGKADLPVRELRLP